MEMISLELTETLWFKLVNKKVLLRYEGVSYRIHVTTKSIAILIPCTSKAEEDSLDYELTMVPYNGVMIPKIARRQ